MATKVQKNFRKEMRKLQKKSRKQKQQSKLPPSYIYRNEFVAAPTLWERIMEMFANFTYFLPRLLMIIGLLYITGMGNEMIRIIQEFIPNSTLKQQQLVMAYVQDYNQLMSTLNMVTTQYNDQLLHAEELDGLALLIKEDFNVIHTHQDMIFNSINMKMALYENAFNTAMGLFFPNDLQEHQLLMSALLNLSELRYEVRADVISLLQQTKFEYELLADDSIVFRSSYFLGWPK
ncbi:MAG TPA: hypothetical protein DCY20_10210 [Firmicutes bacterium]|nr:hypothetical protein [Bacillota bacterium]